MVEVVYVNACRLVVFTMAESFHFAKQVLPANLERNRIMTSEFSKIVLIAFCFTTILCCKTRQKDDYNLISYLDIKVVSFGNLPTNPYILKYKQDDKELLIIGTQHSRDTLSPIIDSIENLFYKFKHELIIN
jgi:hypothetical protein